MPRFVAWPNNTFNSPPRIAISACHPDGPGCPPFRHNSTCARPRRQHCSIAWSSPQPLKSHLRKRRCSEITAQGIRANSTQRYVAYPPPRDTTAQDAAAPPPSGIGLSAPELRRQASLRRTGAHHRPTLNAGQLLRISADAARGSALPRYNSSRSAMMTKSLPVRVSALSGRSTVISTVPGFIRARMASTVLWSARMRPMVATSVGATRLGSS